MKDTHGSTVLGLLALFGVWCAEHASALTYPEGSIREEKTVEDLVPGEHGFLYMGVAPPSVTFLKTSDGEACLLRRQRLSRVPPTAALLPDPAYVWVERLKDGVRVDATAFFDDLLDNPNAIFVPGEGIAGVNCIPIVEWVD